MAISNFSTTPAPYSINLTRTRRIMSTASISYPQQLGEKELRDAGISFNPIGDSYVVRLAHVSGTSAKVLLPSGMVTSFKPRMWHAGTLELLHTLVEDGPVVQVRGGLCLGLRIHKDDVSSWWPDAWTLDRVGGSRRKSIQIELIGRNADGDLDVKHIISLGRDSLTSEAVVRNSTTLPLSLSGSALCHLSVSTPDASYAVGLECSDFLVHPPIVSNFSIIPPDCHPNFGWPMSVDDGEGGEEDDGYKHLTEKLCRIYTSAPRSLTIIDRGRRNSVAIRRSGYNEMYMFSPGSDHEWYNKYSFVCVGHAAILNPLVLNAGSEWRGVLQILNPNS